MTQTVKKPQQSSIFLTELTSRFLQIFSVLEQVRFKGSLTIVKGRLLSNTPDQKSWRVNKWRVNEPESVWMWERERERTGVRALRSGGRRYLTVERVHERETEATQRRDGGSRILSVNAGSGYYSDVSEVAELGGIPPPQTTPFPLSPRPWPKGHSSALASPWRWFYFFSPFFPPMMWWC